MDKPKAKRNHRDVPDGLVGEFAEYSALLRALSIGMTSDLTGQLLRHEQKRRLDEGLVFGKAGDSDEEEEEEAGSDDDESMYSQPIEGPSTSSPPPWPPSTSPVPSSPLTRTPNRSSSSLPFTSSSPPHPIQASRKRKLPAPTTSARKRRTMMVGLTRWPLLLEDVPKPEWTLQDEVGVLMAQLHLDDDDEEENQNQSEIITLSTTHFLESLLGTIAGYTPRRADSMQNRMNTIDWRFVLRATTGREFRMDSKAVRNAERRLWAMYGGGEGGSSSGTGKASDSGSSPRRGLDREDNLNEILYLPPWAPEPQVEVKEVKRRNKPEGVPRRKYEWKDGRKLKRDLIAAAKAKKEAERQGG